MPSARDIVKAAITNLAGAIVVAWLVGQSPELKAWLREQWR